MSNGTVRTNASLNVAGRSVSVPASMRFAANAPRVAAAALFLSPQLRTAVGIASWLGVAKIVWDDNLQAWVQNAVGGNSDQQSDGQEYSVPGYPWAPTRQGACEAYFPIAYPTLGGVVTVRVGYENPCLLTYTRPDGTEGTVGAPLTNRTNPNCPAGWYATPAGCTQTPQPRKLSQEEMVDLLNPANTPGWPMPNSVPREMPSVPLPVQLPVINPNTGVNPFPQPLFVPTGNPVANPNYDPNAAPSPSNQPFFQPGVRVTPAPVPGSPWQVDIQPVNRPQSTNVPNPNPQTDPVENTGDQPAPENEPDLCEKYPDIVACQKLGDVSPVALAKNTVPLQINKEQGFGPDNGVCPAPKQFMVMGKSMAFRWDLLCDFATQIRPLLIGFAYLSAALAFFGLSRRD
ncbi:virulence factor TspB C-terminal domain-related protein [Comamonas endophytica]|uniref:Virulence factor TspB C-terminal domain-related protein n=1 Tax=Comamonas endophytica TaxID=2949090 RepID=A0ABY6G7Y2_9BURK|nr:MULTISPECIES: virulence factor TspB C-terminal domain-related protein [unclassified Acidovorax]MCD2514570.1 hypothetical protein [Acidovorax sp. D4N7]UYG51147.1 virulence factor TspB C-terminal domain-related protein [Acidovorax sp. 5MLIR]